LETVFYGIGHEFFQFTRTLDFSGGLFAGLTPIFVAWLLREAQELNVSSVKFWNSASKPRERKLRRGVDFFLGLKTGLNAGNVASPDAGWKCVLESYLVERSFAWAARFRELACDYERLPKSFAGYHWPAFITLMLGALFIKS
jgi:hypothetical protein